MANDISKLMDYETMCIYLWTENNLEKQVEWVTKLNGNINKQCFMEVQLSENTIHNMRGGVDFSMKVLRSKDVNKSKWVIDIYYMHSLFGDNY